MGLNLSDNLRLDATANDVVNVLGRKDEIFSHERGTKKERLKAIKR